MEYTPIDSRTAYTIRFRLNVEELAMLMNYYARLLADSTYKRSLQIYVQKDTVNDIINEEYFQREIFSVTIVLSSARLSKKMIKRIIDLIPYIDPSSYGQDRG